MFTGLVETTAKFVALDGERLRLLPATPLTDPVKGESVAVNGCCLTLERVLSGGVLEFFVLRETLSRTNLGKLQPGAKLNLERALQLGSRLGGHIVSGHIDAAVKILAAGKAANGDRRLELYLPPELSAEVVQKGSVALNGVSLTVAELSADSFAVMLIPTTLGETNLEQCRVGDELNLETDMLGKYVRRALGAAPSGGSRITMEMLHEAGFL